MEELDRVLDRDDVLRVARVDVVDHRGERRRLTRAGRAGQKDQPALLVGDLVDHGREHQLLGGLDLEGNGAADERDGAALHERVHAEAGHARNRVGEVHLALVPERLQLGLVREHVEEGGLGVLGPERLEALDRHQLAVLADDGRSGDLEMEVGGLRLDDCHEGGIDVEHSSSIGFPAQVLRPGALDAVPAHWTLAPRPRRVASALRRATEASSATGSRSGGSARASR